MTRFRSFSPEEFLCIYSVKSIRYDVGVVSALTAGRH